MKQANANNPTDEHGTAVIGEKVFAPFAGVVRLEVAVDQKVNTGDVVAVVEAVKLEAPIFAPCPAVVHSIAVENFADVSGGDVVATLLPEAHANQTQGSAE